MAKGVLSLTFLVGILVSDMGQKKELLKIF